MYTYDDYYYDEEVINESALDMAIDMSDRYGVAVEDAYEFVCDAMEGSLKDPRKRELRERGRLQIAKSAYNGNNASLDDKTEYMGDSKRAYKYVKRKYYGYNDKLYHDIHKAGSRCTRLHEAQSGK